MAAKRRGKNATGGTRPQARKDADGWVAHYDAPASLLSLLRGTWAKRQHLNAREVEMVRGFLQRARTSPLSDAQIDAAKRIGRSVGVGHDDPAHDDPPAAPSAGVLKVERWGALPKTPPRRAAAS